MKFITYNENFEVQLIHNMPFDEINGLGKTEEELLEIGALVEDIPTVEVPDHKNIVYKYNQEDNTVTYELVDRPLTVEEQNAKDIESINKANKIQDEMIDVCMLATDEIFMMIEPILAQSLNINNINLGGSSKQPLGNLYLTMVIRGLKTIDEVPLTFKDYVLDRLNKK